MSIYRTQTMTPRNGHTLVILTAARISGCQSQKDVSLDDQEEHAHEVVDEVFDGDNVEYRVIATKGKGELLTRPELVEIEEMIRTGELDLIVVEDLGRLVRGTKAKDLVGIAVDHGTRVIAIHDCIDTWEDCWEEDVIAACRDHVGHNAHTSKRLKKKMMLRYVRKGEATPLPIAGYLKPEDATSFHDWRVDETARPIVIEGAMLLRDQLNLSAVADYFNSVEFPTGPYCRNTQWDGAMVRRYYGNTILKGKPERGNMHTVKHHETGRRKSVKNPDGPTVIEMLHLAVIPELLFDEINAKLDERNAKLGRKPYANGQDPLKGIPRKRTRFPGQHARCWYCGRIYVWGGNGIKGNLQCSGCRDWKCWHSIGLNGNLFCQKLVDCIKLMLDELDGIHDEFKQILAAEAESPLPNLELQLRQIESEERELQRQRQNYLDSIGKYGADDEIGECLQNVKIKLGRLAVKKAELDRKSVSISDLPQSPKELSKLLFDKFLDLAIDSYEFGTMLPKIVPHVCVYSVRICDGGPLLPRVKFTVDLTGSFESDAAEELRQLLRREFTVDVFEVPKREKFRHRIVQLKGKGMTLKQIARHIDESISERVISEALKLQKQMETLGIDDPFVVQTCPPNDLKKLRRHRHSRYSFSAADGYQRPEL